MRTHMREHTMWLAAPSPNTSHQEEEDDRTRDVATYHQLKHRCQPTANTHAYRYSSARALTQKSNKKSQVKNSPDCSFLHR